MTKKKTQYVKLPATHRIRNRARKLPCVRTETGFKVTSRVDHFLTISDNGINCDCEFYKGGGLCSHAVCVMMFLDVFPKRELSEVE